MSIYTAPAVPATDTLAHYLSWAQFFGAAMTTCGWTAQTGHGEVVASGAGGAYAWTNVVSVPTVTLNPVQAYTFKGAWVSGATYVGSNSQGAAGEIDVVTSAGLTYVHITATSSLATAPASDTTNWQPLNFEIWKSTGPMSTSLPLYIKFIYTKGTAANGPRFYFHIGTGVDVNGNLTGTVNLTTAAPLYCMFYDSNTTTASSYNCYFSGDADNVRWSMFAGYTTGQHTVLVDRAKTSAGADSDAFAYCATLNYSAGTTISYSGVLLNSVYGGFVGPYTGGWAGIVSPGNSATSLTVMGQTVPLPIYPLIGFQANPLLGAVGFINVDVTDQTPVPVWMYGASHNYLCIRPYTPVAAANTINGVATGGVVPAIRYE